MNLFGNVLAEAVERVAGATGRVAIVVDKVDLTDRLWLRVEGNGVAETEVRAHLYAAYPELAHNLSIGNIQLEIEPNIRLDDQFKAVKIVDLRRTLSPNPG